MSFKDVRMKIYALINFLEWIPVVCELIRKNDYEINKVMQY